MPRAQERLAVRSMLYFAVALAMIALPGALALGSTTVEVPDVALWVKGQSVHADTSDHVNAAPGIGGQVETKDQAFHTNGAKCTIDPKAKPRSGDLTRCDGAKVDAPTSEEASGLVPEYKLDVRLNGAAVAPASPPTKLTPASAAVAAVAANPTAFVAVAAAGASLLGLYAAWRALKWTGLFALLPLYSHISDNEILDDPNRAGIYRLIQSEPGISTKDVAQRLGLAWGTVTHHLGKLEKRRFVVSKKYGKYRRYFANGQGGTEQKDQVAVLRLDRTGDVAALIRAQPGVTQKAVSLSLGVSSSTILWHVKRLEGAQLITKVREGKLVRYYPGQGLDSVLVAPAPVAPAA